MPGGDARKVDPRLRGPIDPRELEIDHRTGMKVRNTPWTSGRRPTDLTGGFRTTSRMRMATGTPRLVSSVPVSEPVSTLDAGRNRQATRLTCTRVIDSSVPSSTLSKTYVPSSFPLLHISLTGRVAPRPFQLVRALPPPPRLRQRLLPRWRRSQDPDSRGNGSSPRHGYLRRLRLHPQSYGRDDGSHLRGVRL